MPGSPDVAVLMICSKLLPTTTKRKKPGAGGSARQSRSRENGAGRNASCEAPQAHDATRRETRARSAASSLRAQGRRQSAQGYAPSMSGPTEKGDFGRDVLSGTLPRRSTLR